MNELEQKRKERDELFYKYFEEAGKASKHSQRAKAYRCSWTLVRDEVRAMERDIMNDPIEV